MLKLSRSETWIIYRVRSVIRKLEKKALLYLNQALAEPRDGANIHVS